jgi:hypothetical protein
MAHAPHVSPDGRLVVFATTVPTQAHVWSRRLFAQAVPHGTRRQLTRNVEFLTLLRVTTDGKQVLASAKRDGEVYIVAVSTEDGEEATLAKGDTPALSPDGSEIIYSVPGSPTRIVALSRAEGQRRLITEVVLPVGGIVVGPDGTLHLTVEGEAGPEAWRVPLMGGVAERDAPAPWTRIVPAPAGGWRAAFRLEAGRSEAHLLSPAMTLGDSAARVVRDVEEVAWDQNGASVIYLEGRRMHRLSVVTGEDVDLLEVSEDFRGAAAVSPDGHTIYFTEVAGQAHGQLITNFGDRPRPR